MASYLLPSACAVSLLLLFVSPVYSFITGITDVDGWPLKKGGEYFIGPAIGFGGLRITRGEDENSPCPLYVQPTGGSTGLPVKIDSSDSPFPYIMADMAVEFIFDRVPFVVCEEPYRWYVAKKDSNGDQHIVVGTTHEFKDTYFFKIVEADAKHSYNIEFCHMPAAGNPFLLQESCNNVGFLDDGLLGITSSDRDPVAFVFTEAKSHSSAS